jgi:hypothetical protein
MGEGGGGGRNAGHSVREYATMSYCCLWCQYGLIVQIPTLSQHYWQCTTKTKYLGSIKIVKGSVVSVCVSSASDSVTAIFEDVFIVEGYLFFNVWRACGNCLFCCLFVHSP